MMGTGLGCVGWAMGSDWLGGDGRMDGHEGARVKVHEMSSGLCMYVCRW